MKIQILLLSVFAMTYCVYGDPIDQLAQALESVASKKQIILTSAEQIQDAFNKIDFIIEPEKMEHTKNFYDQNLKKLFQKALKDPGFNVNMTFKITVKGKYEATIPALMIPLMGRDLDALNEFLSTKRNVKTLVDTKGSSVTTNNNIITKEQFNIFGLLYDVLVAASRMPHSSIKQFLTTLLTNYTLQHSGKNKPRTDIIYENDSEKITLQDLLELFSNEDQSILKDFVS